jgi:hypothetical protein
LRLTEENGAKKKKKGKQAILSLHVSRLNSGIPAEALTEGFALTAYVRSIEDHGYLLDFGISVGSPLQHLEGTHGFFGCASFGFAYLVFAYFGFVYCGVVYLGFAYFGCAYFGAAYFGFAGSGLVCSGLAYFGFAYFGFAYFLMSPVQV